MIDLTDTVPYYDGNVIKDYHEFSRESIENIVANIETHKNINAKDFNDKKDLFYHDSKSYIYDLLGGNPSYGSRYYLINKFISNGFERIKEHPGTSFMEFGGGTGVVCSIVKEYCQKDVTYVDIASYAAEFAAWRFKQHNQKIEMLQIPEADFTLFQQYDIIFTDAVWEHLPPEKQMIYVTKLASCLKDGGMLYFLVDLSGPSELMPMHFYVDIKKVHEHLSDAGLFCQYGLNSFASVWYK